MAKIRILFGLSLICFVCLVSGCVVVSEETFSDISKSDLNRELLGTWIPQQKIGLDEPITYSAPAVEGNPKGLVRASYSRGNSSHTDWAFSTTIGKETYLSLLPNTLIDGVPADFSKPGEFAKWMALERPKSYLVVCYRVDGDKLTVNAGDPKIFRQLKTKLESDPLTPNEKKPRWLADYLAKSGPADLFPKSQDFVYVRQKQRS